MQIYFLLIDLSVNWLIFFSSGRINNTTDSDISTITNKINQCTDYYTGRLYPHLMSNNFVHYELVNIPLGKIQRTWPTAVGMWSFWLLVILSHWITTELKEEIFVSLFSTLQDLRKRNKPLQLLFSVECCCHLGWTVLIFFFWS